MTAVIQIRSQEASQIDAAFSKLKDAHRRNPNPTAPEREDRLERLEAMLASKKDEIVRAVSEDFGHRVPQETMISDVVLTLESIRIARRHVREWMRPEPVSPSPYFLPSKAVREHLPKGVVGIISPWNYPVNLALAPAAGALAAGNRLLIKPSELVPKTSRLLADAIRETFTAEEIAVVEGGPDVARAVTKLPLDHLIFTGSTDIGRKVGQTALDGLVPVTLELGGKSPALVHPDYDIAKAAERIAVGKLFNSGQTCIAPDYALIPRGKEGAFAEAYREVVLRAHPDGRATSIVSDRHHARLRDLVEDARQKGARIEAIAKEAFEQNLRTMAPVLAFEPTDSMRLMQEEIFGPILPVRSYATVDEAIDFIQGRPRPLAFYYFDSSTRRAEDVLRRVVSGGACVNDTLVHVAQEHLPFGGIGASGMGAYHGRAGFETFSHARGVLWSSPLSVARKIQSPPYGKLFEAALNFMSGRIGRWFSK